MSAPASAVEAAIQALRAYHQGRIERVTEELADGFQLGKYRGFLSGDCDGAVEWEEAPFGRLEAEVQKRIVRTAQDAHLVLLASPTLDPTSEGDLEDHVDNVAVTKATWDVLREALRSGVYKPKRGEEPSTAGLRHEARRAA